MTSGVKNKTSYITVKEDCQLPFAKQNNENLVESVFK